MRIGRTIPPAAATLALTDIGMGLRKMFGDHDKSCQRLEKELGEYFDVRHAFLVSSGTAALYLVLQALRLNRPDVNEVILPPYTCYTVPSAVIKAGLRVRLCDFDAHSVDFNLVKLKDTLSRRTLCVLATHFFGLPADVDRIREVCGKDIPIVEDAAQSMGGKSNGRYLGVMGDVGFFSFGRGKNVTAAGGGAILTNSDQIGEALRLVSVDLEIPSLLEELRIFATAMSILIFLRPSMYWLPSGMDFLGLGKSIYPESFPVQRFSRFQTGLMSNWKQRLCSSNEARKMNSQKLIECLEIKGSLDRSSTPWLRLPVLLQERVDKAFAELPGLKRYGVSPMYPESINNIPELKRLFEHESFPVAEGVANRLVTLPTHQFLTEKDIGTVVTMLKGYVESIWGTC